MDEMFEGVGFHNAKHCGQSLPTPAAVLGKLENKPETISVPNSHVQSVYTHKVSVEYKAKLPPPHPPPTPILHEAGTVKSVMNDYLETHKQWLTRKEGWPLVMGYFTCYVTKRK